MNAVAHLRAILQCEKQEFVHIFPFITLNWKVDPSSKSAYFYLIWGDNVLFLLVSRYYIMDNLWWWHRPWVDWIFEFCSWRQPFAHYAEWRKNSVWPKCELCIWNAWLELCFSCHNISHGNDLSKVFHNDFWQMSILHICWGRGKLELDLNVK